MKPPPATPEGLSPVAPRRPFAVPRAGSFASTPAKPFAAVVGQQLASERWLLGYLIFEIGCQVALLFPALSGARVVFRTAPMALSGILFFVLRGPGRPHPSAPLAIGVLAILTVSMFHPDMNSATGGTATVLLNLAVVSPIFWVSKIRMDAKVLRRVFLLVWGFNTLSAIFGALQVYFPGQFQPALTTVLPDESLVGLYITLASGARVFRPMGLSDSPGGAGIGGATCFLFAAAFLLERQRLWARLVFFVSMAVGCFSLYLSQVRSLFVMLAVGIVGMSVPLILRKKFGRLFGVISAVGVVGVGAFMQAQSVGGASITGRLEMLFASEGPQSTYYASRGIFLDYTLTDLLPRYPLGAGLGRWGMMYGYFGDRYNFASPPLWAEIQWTGWLFDGGIALMLAYLLAMWVALWSALRASERDDELFVWTAVLLGYGAGVVALTFSTCPFSGTAGIDFWIINAAVIAATRQHVAAASVS